MNVFEEGEALDDELAREQAYTLPNVAEDLQRRLNALSRQVENANRGIWLIVVIQIGLLSWIWRHFGFQ